MSCTPKKEFKSGFELTKIPNSIFIYLRNSMLNGNYLIRYLFASAQVRKHGASQVQRKAVFDLVHGRRLLLGQQSSCSQHQLRPWSICSTHG